MTPGDAARRAAAVALGAAIVLASAELLVRALRPTPRVQVVDLRRPGLRHAEVEDVTLWWSPVPGAPDLVRGGPCAPGQRVVGLAGDSLFETIEARREHERVADRLQALLREGGVDACVLDGSWGGYVPVQQEAMLHHLAAGRIDAAVTVVWKSDRRLHAVGDRLYDSELVVHDVDFVPRPPLPLPAAAHRWLLPRSRLWEYATLALAPTEDDVRDEALAYLEMSAWASRRALPLVFVEGTPLDAPLATTARARADEPADAPWERLRAAATARAQPYVVLAEALTGEDVEAIRYDTCCHFNARGHDAVARAILPAVRAALGVEEASTGAAPTR